MLLRVYSVREPAETFAAPKRCWLRQRLIKWRMVRAAPLRAFDAELTDGVAIQPQEPTHITRASSSTCESFSHGQPLRVSA